MLEHLTDLLLLGRNLVEALPKCQPAAPSMVGLAEGLAAIALLVAFRELARPIVRLRMRVSRFSDRTALALISIALAFILIATLLPLAPPIPLLTCTSLWEVPASLILVLAPLTLIYTATTRSKISKRNWERFAQNNLHVIATGSEQDLKDLGLEIYGSVDVLLEGCAAIDRAERFRAGIEGRNYEYPRLARIALTMFELWSDARLCRSIVTSAPATATHFFLGVRERGLEDLAGSQFGHQLVTEAFRERASILYREQEFAGLGNVEGLFESVFGSYKLVEGRTRPLGILLNIKVVDRRIESWQVKRYCECVERSIQALLADSYPGYPSALHNAFTEIAEVVQRAVWDLNEIIDHPASTEAFERLYEATSGFENCVRAVLDALDGPESRMNVPAFDPEQREFSDWTVHAAIGRGMYRLIEAAGAAGRHDFLIRSTLIGAWIRIYSEGKHAESVAERLNVQLIGKVKQNLIEGYYPAVTRVLISVLGLVESGDRTRVAESALRNEFFSLIRKYYEPLAKKRPRVAADMLPEGCIYDPTMGSIIERRSWPRGDRISTFRIRGGVDAW